MAPEPHQAYVGVVGLRPQGGAARERDQGRPGPLQPRGPGAGRQRHAHPRHRDGRPGSIELKGRELGVDLSARPDAVGRVAERVKDLEAEGWSFEAADASFELLVRAELGRAGDRAVHAGVVPGDRRAPRGRRGGQRGDGEGARKGERIIATAEGNGPVNALDQALRSALEPHYPAAGRARAGRLQGAHPGRAARHRRGHPGAGGDRRRRGGSGPRSACTPTSSRRPGWRWPTRSGTGCWPRSGSSGRRVRYAVVRTRSAVAVPAPDGPPVLCRAWRSLRDTGPAGGDRRRCWPGC